ncbi:MAG: hypothetical protein WEC37_03005 [Anaerolineales bacterium]
MSVLKIRHSKLILSSLIAAVLLLSTTQVALASPDNDCIAAGGIWKGATPDTGTCHYGAGDQVALDHCRPFASYQETYDAGVLTSAQCINTRGFGNSGDSTSNKDNSQPVTLRLYSKNGYATFGAGVCVPFQCTISANLPAAAKAALPDTTQLGHMYVRVAGSQSTAYRVCFNNPKADNMAIFRFMGGSWIAITARVTSTPICVSASGDGSFYIGSG